MRKRWALLAAVLLAAAPSASLAAGNGYYWSDGRKITLHPDPGSMVVVYRESALPSARLARGAALAGARVTAGGARFAVLEGVAMPGATPLSRLAGLGVDPSQVAWASNGYTFEDGSRLRPTDRICFGLAPGHASEDVLRMMAGRAALVHTPMGTPMLRVTDPAGDVLALANELYESGLVAYAHPDFVANIAFGDSRGEASVPAASGRTPATIDKMIIIEDDPPGGGGPTIPDYYPQQWYLNNTGQTGGTPDMDIDAPEAWAYTQGSPGTIVAVVDDGVEVHEDIPSYRFVAGYTPTTGGNGSPVSGAAHAECVAGIIGANRNGYGVSGVAPQTSLMSINVDFAHLEVTDQDIADGINWAWQHGAAVLNNSWGYTSPYDWVDVVKNAIDEALLNGRAGRGCVVVFSAGNNYPGGYWWCPGYVSFPALVPGVVCVSAINKFGDISSYSSRGKRVDLSAFGGEWDVYSTDRMGTAGYGADNYYAGFTGTSAAAPQVSGVAALVLALHPTWTGQQVVYQLLESAVDRGPAGRDTLYGVGVLNALGAVHESHAIDPDPTIAQALANALPGQTVTVASGARRIDTDLVVPAGVTLRLNSGVELWFGANKGIHVHGMLTIAGSSASDVRLSGIEGAWSGITFYDRLIGAGDARVLGDLTGCTIDHASGPITADFGLPQDANDWPIVLIDQCLVQNSSFTGDAGIAISNSEAYLYNSTIVGGYDSANGVRLSNCQADVSNCTVEFCGAGNGITVNGVPADGWVSIHDSMIRQNAFNQVYAINTWGGWGAIVDGNCIRTGLYGDRTATGVAAFSGYVELADNAIDNQAVGLSSAHMSTLVTGSYNGWNFGPDDVRGNVIGAEAYYVSTATLPYNNFLSNTTYDLVSWNRSHLTATGSWCGNPGGVPLTSFDPSSTGSWSSPAANYLPGAPFRPQVFFTAQRGQAGSARPTSARGLMERAQSSRASRAWRRAEAEPALATGDPALDAWHEWRVTRGSAALATLERLAVHDDATGLTALETLPIIYSSQGRPAEAKAAALEIRRRAPDTEAELGALAFLGTLGNADVTQREASRAYRHELAARFGSRVPRGLVAAISDRPAVAAPAPVAQQPAPPLGLALAPNPVITSGVLHFTLPAAGPVSIKLFDVLGREVSTLLEGTRPAGRHALTFDAGACRAGVYFCRLATAAGEASQKVLVLR